MAGKVDIFTHSIKYFQAEFISTSLKFKSNVNNSLISIYVNIQGFF